MLLVVLNSLFPANDERQKHRYEPLVKLYHQLFNDHVNFVRYNELDASKSLNDPRLTGIILGGMPDDYDQYPDGCWEEEYKLIYQNKVPTLGICGGFHLIAMAYNFKVEKKLNHRGEFVKEKGWREVNIIKDSPLFKGLPEIIVVDEGHSWEITELGNRFSVLAWNDFSKIQALQMNDIPLWGVQFHPEIGDKGHPHGGIILRNFVQML